jgi:aspartate--ammonia ligase
MKTHRAHYLRGHGLAIPAGYRPALGLLETEAAIKFIKDFFQNHLARALTLKRVSAPIAVTRTSGINDYLSGVEEPVGFVVRETRERAEIVQSLAKWKRAALADYGLADGQGLYTDMNAIRPDEHLDNLHSIYVDQWDWERAIHRSDRTLPHLKMIVRRIYAVMRATERAACRRYPKLGPPWLPPRIHFIHSEELEKRYPHLPPFEREREICRNYGAVFIIGIGATLADGRPHDDRAPDYDDWWTETGRGRRGLNGDILVWYPVLSCAYELSSMGIRVDATSLRAQLRLKDKKELSPYHRRLLAGKLPLSIGGGIGQSRLCMYYLRKAHIGEVQSSIWPEQMIRACHRRGIPLL